MDASDDPGRINRWYLHLRLAFTLSKHAMVVAAALDGANLESRRVPGGEEAPQVHLVAGVGGEDVLRQSASVVS
jgi:hypothetical protein